MGTSGFFTGTTGDLVFSISEEYLGGFLTQVMMVLLPVAVVVGVLTALWLRRSRPATYAALREDLDKHAPERPVPGNPSTG